MEVAFFYVKKMKNQPPKKQKGEATGPRKIAGELLDVGALADLLGISEDMVRARVTRRQLPFKRWSGRIVFLRSEVTEFFDKLEGVSVEEAAVNERFRRTEVTLNN